MATGFLPLYSLMKGFKDSLKRKFEENFIEFKRKIPG